MIVYFIRYQEPGDETAILATISAIQRDMASRDIRTVVVATTEKDKNPAVVTQAVAIIKRMEGMTVTTFVCYFLSPPRGLREAIQEGRLPPWGEECLQTWLETGRKGNTTSLRMEHPVYVALGARAHLSGLKKLGRQQDAAICFVPEGVIEAFVEENSTDEPRLVAPWEVAVFKDDEHCPSHPGVTCPLHLPTFLGYLNSPTAR